MKGNTTGLVLLGLTLASALGTTVLCIMTIGAISQQQYMQTEGDKVQLFRERTRALISDAADYSSKNPTITPVLKKYGITPTPASAVTPRK